MICMLSIYSGSVRCVWFPCLHVRWSVCETVTAICWVRMFFMMHACTYLCLFFMMHACTYLCLCASCYCECVCGFDNQLVHEPMCLWMITRMFLSHESATWLAHMHTQICITWRHTCAGANNRNKKDAFSRRLRVMLAFTRAVRNASVLMWPNSAARQAKLPRKYRPLRSNRSACPA